jgi:hypothetical protein
MHFPSYPLLRPVEISPQPTELPRKNPAPQARDADERGDAVL